MYTTIKRELVWERNIYKWRYIARPSEAFIFSHPSSNIFTHCEAPSGQRKHSCSHVPYGLWCDVLARICHCFFFFVQCDTLFYFSYIKYAFCGALCSWWLSILFNEFLFCHLTRFCFRGVLVIVSLHITYCYASFSYMYQILNTDACL